MPDEMMGAKRDIGDEVTITVRTNGPYRVRGPVKIVDADGNEFRLEDGRDWISLCRCGQSEKKPFCDGTHKKIGFCAETKAQ